jgi:hypothetical protein
MAVGAAVGVEVGVDVGLSVGVAATVGLGEGASAIRLGELGAGDASADMLGVGVARTEATLPWKLHRPNPTNSAITATAAAPAPTAPVVLVSLNRPRRSLPHPKAT